MDYKQISEARSLALPYGQSFQDYDGHPIMQVQYVPDAGTGATAATMDVAVATDLTFQVGGTDPAGKDAIGSSSGVVLFSSYATLGALVDYINGRQAWRAYLIGGLRADASASKLLVKGATSCIGATGLTIYGDASANKHGSFAISGERFISNSEDDHGKDWEDQCENSLIYIRTAVGATDAGLLTIYAEKQTGTSVQTLYSEVFVDDAELVQGVGNGESLNQAWLTAPRGYRLVGRITGVGGAATYDDSIVDYQITGKSAVLKGDRFVDSKNWS